MATGLKDKEKGKEQDVDREDSGRVKHKHPKLKNFFITLLVLAIIAAAAYVVLSKIDIGSLIAKNFGKEESEPEIITVSDLEKIINVSELSTYTAVYNGIAQVMNEEKPEETDYYVAYEARVKAGIDFSKADINIDDKAKTINLSIPEIYITDINVAPTMDYIFMNEDANQSAVSAKALAVCEEDVREESEAQEKIFELAEQNAKQVLTALIRPLIELKGAGYVLIID